jgi:hypothetical protein
VSGEEGVLYSCTGERYVAEALRSARSSLRFNQLPHLLYTTEDVEHSQPGLTIVRFEPSASPYADKIANMRRSPFERTLYLDTDTYVLAEVAHLLALLDRFDMAVAFTAEGRGPHDPGVPGAFFEFNTGVLAWRANERMAAFMRSWEETYIDWREHGDPFPTPGKGSASGRADQLAFRRCAWEHDISVFVLAPEYNFRLGYPTTVGSRVAIIHGRHDDYEGLAARVNASDLPRSWPPPLSLVEKAMRRVRPVSQRMSS